MSSTFTCLHCHIRYKSNPRLKTPQKYCNSKSCQQARKNRWEQEKLKNDSTYKAKRKAAKKKWYSTYPADQYQSTYRATHPEYCKTNREKQYKRNAKGREKAIAHLPAKAKAIARQAGQAGLVEANTRDTVLSFGLPANESGQTGKIVKTDALRPESVDTQRFYLLLPYEKPDAGLPLEKIVKTDALIVQIIATTGLQGNILQENSSAF